MNFKKFSYVFAVVLLAVSIYPLVSSSKSDTKSTVVLNDKNSITLSGEISGESVAVTIKKLQKLDSETKLVGKPDPIYLVVYSPGGSIQAGLELIEAAQGMKRQVNTITMFAASMAFNTVENLGERLILKNGVLMSHRAAGGFEGSFGGTHPSQLDSRYGFWLQRIAEMDEQVVKRSGGKQTIESYREFYRDELWRTGEQSVAQGYADAVVTARCDKTLDGVETHSVDFMGFLIKYDVSLCPLITAAMNIRISAPGEKSVTPLSAAVIEDIKNKFVDTMNFAQHIK